MFQGRHHLGWLLAAALATALPLRAQEQPPPSPIRLTIEATWSSQASDFAAATPAPAGLTIELVDGGRVVDASPWPAGSSDRPVPADPAVPTGPWKLGKAQSGRVRARVEAPISARLVVRQAESEVLSVPILSLLDGPQRSGPDSPVAVEVARLPWDSIELTLAGDGTAPPGELVPVTVGFNVLTPVPAEVELTLKATLRPLAGGDPVWQVDRQTVIATNTLPAPGLILPVQAPATAGTYVLELTTTWKSSRPTHDGPVLRGWWKRLKRGTSDTATRRVSLAFVSPGHSTEPPGPAADEVVDTVDLGRPRMLRPFTSGRSAVEGGEWPVPEPLLVEPQRRERLWNLIGRVGSDFRPLGPADPQGLSWVAVPLRVPHPGRPHRLDLRVLGGDAASLSIALVAPGRQPRLILDSRGSGPAVAEGGSPLSLSWPIWPDSAEPVLVVVNRSPTEPLWLGDAQLLELAGGPPALAPTEPPSSPKRRAGLHLASPRDLDRFGFRRDGGPADVVGGARNLATYLDHCGANLVVLPTTASDRPSRAALDGQAGEDSAGPDRLALATRLLRARGLTVWFEAPADGPLEGLPTPDSPEAATRGLLAVGAQGKPNGPLYNPLQPDVRRAMTDRLVSALKAVGEAPDGLLLRLGPGSTLPGRPDAGLDDETYGRFVKAAISGGKAPGLAGDARFTERAKFVSGPGLVPWLSWRAEEVAGYYASLSRSIAEAAPGARLVVATPGPHDGTAADEASRCDRDGLPPHEGWRAAGLDLSKWPTGPDAPLVLRGVGLGGPEPGHDLDLHPDLDEQIRPRPERGTLIVADAPPSTGRLALAARGLDSGPAGDERAGHALAALDAHWLILPADALAGQEERFRRVAAVVRALPVTGAIPPSPIGDRSGTVARAVTAGPSSYVTLGNDTPYAVRLMAILESPPVAVDDLGRGLRLRHDPAPVGGKRVVVDLPPHGTTVLRVEAPGVRVRSVAPYYDGAPDLARREVSRRLRRLAEDGNLPGLDPGFEGRAGGEGTIPVSREEGPPRAWAAEGSAGAKVEIDSRVAHGGQSSLRLDSPAGPAAAVSSAFVPPSDDVTIRAWLRAEPPDTRVRVRVESADPALPVRLRADLPARGRAEWMAEALRAAGLPSDGRTPVRLRFELLGPGTLWLDDLSVSAEGQAQARSCLTAALEAFEEGRYADFARLANSHWARRIPPAPEPAPMADAAAGAAPSGTGTAATTDLPSRPRLR